MKNLPILILVLVFSLGGCSLAPKYIRPQAPIPEQWPTGQAYPQVNAQTKVTDAMLLEWRQFFTDPKLQQIIEISLANNRDLRLAALNMERARALYGVQFSQLLPVVDAQAGYTKQRYSADQSVTGVSTISKLYSVDLGITAWEVDFFGRIRNLTKQALEEYLNTVEARRSAQISLISEVAKAYFIVATDKTLINLAQTTLETQQTVYNLILKQYNVKIANEIDLQRAQTQVDTAKGDLVLYMQRLARDKNALDLLAGSTVPEELLPLSFDSVKPLADIFPGLKSQVLLKRPDIVAAEHTLKGAYANIGAARAAFFPNVSVTTAIGSVSNQFSNLFKGGKGAWIYSPQIVMPIFDSGTWAAYRVSEADRKIALTQYEKAIQVAFSEVADVLAVQGTVDQQMAIQQSLVNSAQKVYQLADKRYANGIDSYLSVLDAQRSLYRAQTEFILIQLSKFVNESNAYAVLGGGATEETETKNQSKRAAMQDRLLSTLDSK